MNELVCPRCAAVIANVQSTAVCSNCGYDFRVATARIRLVASRYLWLIFLLPFAVVTIRSGAVFSAIVAIFVVLAMGFSSTAKMRQSLSLGSDAPRTHVPSPSFAKPRLPTEWESIARLPRPRDVHVPSATKVWTLIAATAYVAGFGFAIHSLWKNSAVSYDNLFLLLWLVFYVSIGTASVRTFFADREVLREGELTPGILTDWTQGRHGISIRYQFWTPSGQRFESSGKVNSRRDLMRASDGILPVLYLNHQPKRNVALCCTHLRITTIV